MLRYIAEEMIFPAVFGFRNYNADANLAYYYIDNLYFACLYSAFGIVYFFIQRDAFNQLSQTKLQLANKQTELSFLRSQVNPHFLFNSLNNIYSLVYHESDQSLTAIAKLSDLLRYMLYDTNEKVPLQKELDYINKYIELQQMRFEHGVPVQVKVTGNTDKASIPPLLLIPFVENAFKHGDLKNTQPITVDVSVDDNAIRFYSSNAVGNHQKDAIGGIGLENVRRRLELLYPGRYIMEVQKTANTFTIQLEIRK
jgi:LytS/YehU family sensor histidine kinase